MSIPFNRKNIYLALPCLLAVAACSETEQQTAATPPAPAQSTASTPGQTPGQTPPAAPQTTAAAPVPGHPPVAPPTAHPSQGDNTGKVLNIAQAGPYTYVEVDQNGRSVWLAGNRADVAVGDQVRWGNSAVMRNFTSKSLNRVFDQILFVSSIQPVGASASAPAAATAVAGGPSGVVTEVMNAAGYTYMEVESGGQKKWLAAPQSRVTVGDRVAWQGGNTMLNFKSNSLNRSFDRIDFVASVTVNP